MIVIVDTADGRRFGVIFRAGVVVRAPAPMLLGASRGALAEWALYGGHILTPLDIAECTKTSSGDGSEGVEDYFRFPNPLGLPSKTPGQI